MLYVLVTVIWKVEQPAQYDASFVRDCFPLPPEIDTCMIIIKPLPLPHHLLTYSDEENAPLGHTHAPGDSEQMSQGVVEEDDVKTLGGILLRIHNIIGPQYIFSSYTMWVVIE